MIHIPKETVGVHSDREWREKLNACQWRCYWCNHVVTKRSVEKDHLQPLARGGSDRIDNIVPCCGKCNRMKGLRNEEEFRDYLARISAGSGKEIRTKEPPLPPVEPVRLTKVRMESEGLSWAWKHPA